MTQAKDGSGAADVAGSRQAPATDGIPGEMLDLDALRERYRLERERRTPREGERRYRDVERGFAHLASDRYADVTPRAALHDAVDVVVIGGGFGGLLAAARLRESGVARVRIIEAGSDVGGAWYWNRYPGAACDVESYIYLPLLEETGYMPVERYSKAAEIRAHARRIAEHYGLYEDACFSTQVTRLDWDAPGARWLVSTDRGDRIQARFVVLTTGPLHRPKLPAIPGIERFSGHMFHTSRWDYSYTGGSATEPMARLADKRVGIIGTGATAIQCVPPLAAAAAQVYVFQRTPSSVDARGNAPTDPDWVAGLTPGWQQRRIRNFTAQLSGDLSEEDQVGDGWTVLARAVRRMLAHDPKAHPAALLERADLAKMVEIRERIDAIVQDRPTAEALKPWFSLFCKRPCFHDEYLATFNRPNVTLVDTAGRGVEAITEHAAVVAGIEYPIDCLVLATGFEVSSSFARRSGFEVYGIDGVSLTEKWAQGMSTLHGMYSRGFPNCFIVGPAQSGMSPNFPHMLDEQAKHAAQLVRHCLARSVRTLEPSAAAERDWVARIVAMSASRVEFLNNCTPGYYNGEGRASDALARSQPFGAGPLVFVEMLRQWRESGDFDGMEFDGETARSRGAS